MAEPTVQNARVTHDQSSPGWRLAAAVLAIGAMFLLAYGLQLQGALQIAATVLSVACLHVVAAMSQRRTDGPNLGAPETNAGEPAALNRIRKDAAFVGSAILEDYPWLSRWVGRGSLSVEIIKGLLAGGVTVILQQTIAAATQEHLGDQWSLVLSILISVTAIHVASAVLAGATRRNVELNKSVAALVTVVPLLERLLTPQSLGWEAVKGAVKGASVYLLRAPLLVAAGWFANVYFAGAVGALIAACIIAPNAVKVVVDALTSTKKKERAQ